MRGGKKKLSNLVNRFESIMSDMTSDVQIEIHSNRLMLISGCRKLTEYNTNNVKLLFKKMSLEIEGKDLVPESLINGQMAVRGIIEAVRYIDDQKTC